MASRGLDLREGLIGLFRLASGDVGKVWGQVSTFAEASAALGDLLPPLLRQYGLAAGALAADWYDSVREQAGVPGRFTAIPADPGPLGADVLIDWARGTSSDLSSFRALVEGGAQRRVANVARQTITGSSIVDPHARGWQRVGIGKNCEFCEMLISRGAVYSDGSADFASHDHCNCQAVPAFRGEPRPVKPYTPSLRGSTDADRARVRAWIATNL